MLNEEVNDLYYSLLEELNIVFSRIKIIFWNVGIENVYFGGKSATLVVNRERQYGNREEDG